MNHVSLNSMMIRHYYTVKWNTVNGRPIISSVLSKLKFAERSKFYIEVSEVQIMVI
jgi:hypothetical protein